MIETCDPAQENVFSLQYDPYSRIRPVIAARGHHTVGLNKDGSVIAAGCSDHGQCNVRAWQDIVAIAAGSGSTVGLKADGTVVAVGSNEYDQCNVSSWRDIVAIADGEWHTVGLKKDGTVIAVGDNGHGETDVGEYKSVKETTSKWFGLSSETKTVRQRQTRALEAVLMKFIFLNDFTGKQVAHEK